VDNVLSGRSERSGGVRGEIMPSGIAGSGNPNKNAENKYGLVVGDRVTLRHIPNSPSGEIIKIVTSASVPKALVYFGTYRTGKNDSITIRTEHWVNMDALQKVEGTIRAGTQEWHDRERGT